MGEAPEYSVIADDRVFSVKMSENTNGLVYLRREGDSLIWLPKAPEVQEDSSTRAPGMVVLARLRQTKVARAPLLVVRNGLGSAELPCRDDGVHFDDHPNDALFLCVGWLPGPETTEDFETDFVLRGEEGVPRLLANVIMPGGAGLRFAHLDIAGESTPDTTPMDLAQAVVFDSESGLVHMAVGHGQASGIALDGAGSGRLNPLSAVFTVFALMLGVVLGWRLKTARPGGDSAPLLRWNPTPDAERPTTDLVVQSPNPADKVRARVAELGADYRVIVVDPTGDLAIPGCFALHSNDVWDLLVAVDVLTASPGAPVAVIISGRETLKDAASPTPDALTDARQALAGRAVVMVVEEGSGV
jgi:hypothetical protein